MRILQFSEHFINNSLMGAKQINLHELHQTSTVRDFRGTNENENYTNMNINNILLSFGVNPRDVGKG